jgi:hypothetical protein
MMKDAFIVLANTNAATASKISINLPMQRISIVTATLIINLSLNFFL